MTARSTAASRRAALAAACLVLVACAPNGSEGDRTATTEPGPSDSAGVTGGRCPPAVAPDREVRPHVGPRAFDDVAATLVVLDALESAGDDVFVRLRVVNGSATFLDLGVRDTFYGPLAVMTDDLGGDYPAFAVEPTGVDAHSVGQLRLRLRGPLDPAASELTLRLETIRGPLTIDRVPAPCGDAVAWWSEGLPVSVDGAATAGHGERTMRVTEVVDRGSHLEVALEVEAASDGGLGPVSLTSTDDGEYPLVPFGAEPRTPAGTSVVILRFVGPFDDAVGALRLTAARVELDIPTIDPSGAGTASGDPPVAPSAQLPELLHHWLTDEPLPLSVVEN